MTEEPLGTPGVGEGCPLDQGLNRRLTTNLTVELGATWESRSGRGTSAEGRPRGSGLFSALVPSLPQEPGLGEPWHWGPRAFVG